MDVVPYLAAVSAIAALALAFYYYKVVEKASPGNERMVFLMTEIQKGAKAFLKKEYQWVSVFVVAMMILLGDRDQPARLGHVPARRRAVGHCRLRRHDRRHDGERPHDRGRQVRTGGSAAGRLPRRRRDGLLGRRSRAARPDGHLPRVRRVVRGRRGVRDLHRLRPRRIVDRTVRPCRRRHLHQGCRRRRRPRRQGRGGHPRGRPAQPGHDRRQRGRQRRRRRRHGRRPVRVVRRIDHRADLADRLRARPDRRPGRRPTGS